MLNISPIFMPRVNYCHSVRTKFGKVFASPMFITNVNSAKLHWPVF